MLANNRSSTFYVDLDVAGDGQKERMTLAYACQIFHKRYHTAYKRITELGWSAEEAMGLERHQRPERLLRPTDIQVTLPDGRVVTLRQAAKEYGIRYHTVWARLKVYGWPIEKSLGIAA
jgi:hypothetical protein